MSYSEVTGHRSMEFDGERNSAYGRASAQLTAELQTRYPGLFGSEAEALKFVKDSAGCFS